MDEPIVNDIWVQISVLNINLKSHIHLINIIKLICKYQGHVWGYQLI